MVEKNDNSSFNLKIKVRNKILSLLDEQLHVIDSCAGDQRLWNELKLHYDIQSYIPIDHSGKKNAINAEAQELFFSCNIPEKINVIDIDAYGSPWEIYKNAIDSLIIKKKIAIFITRGLIRMKGGGGLSKAEIEIAGIPSDWNIPKSNNIISAIDKSCLTYPLRFGWKIKKCIKAASKSSNYIHYYGLLLE